MCLIVVAWQTDPDYSLLVATNRDEYHARPTEPAHWWPPPADFFAGRDCRAGGTWCGADRAGRWAAVTNVREPDAPASERSRGALVADYLAGNHVAASWAAQVWRDRVAYSPFNLLIGDLGALWFVSNRDRAGPRQIPPGVYAISNGPWHARWPKTGRAAQALRACIDRRRVDPATLFTFLGDTTKPPDDALPSTGLSLAAERALSPLFIQGAHYGTRASTVIRRRRSAVDFHEREFDWTGAPVHRIAQHWTVKDIAI